MARLALAVLALFVGSCYAGAISRIVGGQDTTINEFPSLVQVENLGVFSTTWSQSCAANILTSRSVLSAAHCFSGLFYLPERRRIRAGSTFRNSGGVVVNVLEEFNHPSYGELALDGDITVVRLETALQYNPVIQQGPIIYQDAVIPDDISVTVAGWGATEDGGFSSPVLQQVEVFTINNNDCREVFGELAPPRVVTQNMICIGYEARGPCNGDSGGPVYRDGVLVGVISWGLGCSDETFPWVATNVGSYTNWIAATAV